MERIAEKMYLYWVICAENGQIEHIFRYIKLLCVKMCVY